MYNFNEYQTQLTEEVLSSLHPEVKEGLTDVISNVEFIKRLVSPTRERAKDRPRNSSGRIVVDLCNPHILENMDYFRPVALYYKEHGCLTKLRPNANPNSEFGKWIRTEIDRIWHGMVRESDGEWIPGTMYYYLNYMPIIQTLLREEEGKKIVDRVVDFPRVWEGVYLFYHYVDQARYGGIYNNWKGNEDAVVIAKRGAPHPLSSKCITPDGIKTWGEIKVGDTLFTKNGTTKVIREIPQGTIPIYKITLKDGRVTYGGLHHIWEVYRSTNKEYKQRRLLTTEELLRDYVNNRTIKGHSTTNREYKYFIGNIEPVHFPTRKTPVDAYTFGLLLGGGTFRLPKHINRTHYTSTPEDMEIYRKIIPYPIIARSSKCAYSICIDNIGNYLREVGLYMTTSSEKFIPKEYLFNSEEVRLNLLKGLMDSDGTVTKTCSVFTTTSERLKEDFLFLVRSLGINASCKKRKSYLNGERKRDSYQISLYTDKVLFNLPRKINKLAPKTTRLERSKIDYTTIVDISYSHDEEAKCVTVDSQDSIYLIDDFIPTHNSKSYSCAAMLARMFVIGENERTCTKTRSIVTAFDKEKLIKDGILNKFVEAIDFASENTQFPSHRLKSAMDDMYWIMGYKDPTTGINKGTLNEVMGVAANDDPDKARGKRGNLGIYEEFGAFRKFIDTWSVNKRSFREGSHAFGQRVAIGCVCKDTEVYDKEGKRYLIQDITKDRGIIGYKDNKANIESITYIQDYCEKDCVEIKHTYGTLRCSVDHPIYCKVPTRSRITGYRDYREMFVPAGLIKKSYQIAEIDRIDVWGKETLFDPYLVGILIGDGSYGHDKTPRVSNCDIGVLDYIKSNYTYRIERERLTKDNRVYQELRVLNICPKLREIGIYGQVKENKELPINFESLSREQSIKLLAGLFDADGCVSKNNITMGQPSERVLQQVSVILRKLGILCTIRKVKSSKFSTYADRASDRLFYWMEIKDKRSLYNFAYYFYDELKILYKKERLLKFFNIEHTTVDNIRWRGVKSITEIGIQQIYNLTADDSHTYLANRIITHNTGGSEGSDFYGALEMIYSPEAYDVYALPNVFDKNSQGKQKTVFFFGAYLNRLSHYNQDGVSDVIGALIEILTERVKIKYSASDPMSLTRAIAEDPLTIQEAIMRREATIYPVSDLTERKNQLDQDPHSYDDIWLGDLVIKDGSVVYSPTNIKRPIREFPLKDNKAEGCIEIFTMPILDSSKKPYAGRYIAGIDTYDDDVSGTLSLGSIFVLDLVTDQIVCEYTGRPQYADEFYEICRRILLFYNAVANYENNKKGLYAYFSRMNSLYLLSDTLEFLKDKDLASRNAYYGNKAHPYSQLVRTPQGIKRWEDIKIGDELWGTSNNITKVVDIPFDGITDIYNITLRDGRCVQASLDHLWKVVDWNGYNKVVSTRELINGFRKKGKYKESMYYIPKNMGVEYSEKPIPLNPYFLGLMLGDGCFTTSKHHQAYFTSKVVDLKEYMKVLNYEYHTIDDRHHYIKFPNIGKILRELNLHDKKSHTKFIPPEYKYNSREVRLDILQGLLDTDGNIGYGGNAEYCTVSKQLAEDVIEVARSLGINCNLNTTINSYGSVYKVRFYSEVALFKLKRKYSKQRITKTRSYKTAITDVSFSHREKAKCVTVDSKDNCYLIGDFVTTHNSKGSNASAFVKSYYRMRIRDWLLKPLKIEKEENGTVIEETVPLLTTIKSRALLSELIQWNPDNNYDRHDALGMLMLLREDRLRILGDRDVSALSGKERKQSLADDAFFKNNFKKENHVFSESYNSRTRRLYGLLK